MDSAATNPQTPRPQPSRNASGPAAGASASPAPTPRATHVVGEPVVFDGYVDDFENNIAAMQFSLDDGATWTTYKTCTTTGTCRRRKTKRTDRLLPRLFRALA